MPELLLLTLAGPLLTLCGTASAAQTRPMVNVKILDLRWARCSPAPSRFEPGSPPIRALECPSKRLGHACIFDPRTRSWPSDLKAFYQAAADAGVIVKFNHPGSGNGVFNGLAYSEIGDKAVQPVSGSPSGKQHRLGSPIVRPPGGWVIARR